MFKKIVLFTVVLCFSFIAMAQQQQITGTVVDVKGNPIPGATVLVEGTQNGTATDPDGKFTLMAPANGTLLVSFIGYTTEKVALAGKTSIQVVLREDAEIIEEVVVVGYGSGKRVGNIVGSVSTVSAKEIAGRPTANIGDALQGKVPGLQIFNTSGEPQSTVSMKLRGTSSLRLATAPLYILDGVPVQSTVFTQINPQDIENISILKDASATAIYGSRAANGVVVVTTKSPQPGELKVSYNMTLTLTAPDLSDYNLLDAEGKLKAEYLSGYYHSDDLYTQRLLDKDYAYRLSNVKRGVDTYWLSQPLETAVGHKHSLYIEGGDKNVRYGVDVNYQANPGVMKKSKRDRMGIGFLLSYNLNNKLLFRNKLSVDKVKAKESPYGSFSSFAKANPYFPTHDENGKLMKEYPQFVAATYRHLNPLYEAQLNQKDQQEYLEMTNNFDLDWFISDHFRVKGRVSYSERNDKQEKFIDPGSNRYEAYEYQEGDGILKKGEAYNYDQKSSNLDANVVLTYTQQFGKHYLNGALGGNMIQKKFANESYSVIGFPSGNMDYVSFGKEFKDQAPDGEEGVSRLVGMFLNLNYTFNNKY